MTIPVRRVRADDWPALRDLRLEALEDTPIAFLETLEAARAAADEVWQARAARGSVDGDAFQVMAWEEDRVVGTCVCFLRDEAAWLAAVYVAPAYRGQGLVGRLAQACAEWGREQGMGVLRLEVHEDNGRAQAAYARLGFRDTGERGPYPLPPYGLEVFMERSL